MTGARFSNVEKIEMQELRHALRIDLLTERARGRGTLDPLDESGATRQL